MISFKVENVQYEDGSMGLRIDGHCLSTDTKPFNEDSKEWVKQGASEVESNG